MKHHAVLVIVALCSLAACSKKSPPIVTGSFEGEMRQIVDSPSQHRPTSYGSRFVITLSDPQETSTAVRLLLNDTVSGGAILCVGRAPRTDRDDGASFTVPVLSCHLASPDGTPRYQSPQCQIQAQALGLRYDRAANQLTLDVGGLDVAFTATPADNHEPCGQWIRAQAPNATALRAQAPAAAVR